MPEEITLYISKYGYAAIFTIIILQETGVPNPVPVELLVFFTGYLCYKKLLHLPFVIITAIGADLAGAAIIYGIFYTSGIFLIKKKPKWLPLSEKKIRMFQEKINHGGWLSIFLFRLVSITRGYAAIISGLLHINLRIYAPTVIIAAITWTSFYAIMGYILGPSSNMIFSDAGHFKLILLGIVLLVISILIFVWFRKKRLNKKGL